jgi:hypothetical protein
VADPTTERRITGDDIISELIRNLESGAFKVRYTTLVPCIFNVYLHPDDFEQIKPVAEFVRAEAREALTEHIERLNKATAASPLTRALRLGTSKATEYKILEADWRIEFHSDDEEHLRRGDIEIYSELASEQHAEFAAGSMTTFITRRPAESESPAAQNHAPAESSTPAEAARTARQVFAYLRYSDETGAKTFPVTATQTVIGRGGKSFWVDLKLAGPADISREHCRIRRDEESGAFYIKDLSQYGTGIDGQPVPSSLERTPAGEKVDRNVEVPLPPRCAITLAGVFTIQFEAVQGE